MKKDEYIASAVSKISNKKAKRETEKELAEHIDELIEHYEKSGWQGDEAEERAISDMGVPEAVSSLLGRLHTGAGKVIFLVLIALLGLFLILEVFGEMVSLNYEPMYILFSAALCRKLGLSNTNLFYYINILLLYLSLFLLTVFGIQ